jgi:hypothetical protein
MFSMTLGLPAGGAMIAPMTPLVRPEHLAGADRPVHGMTITFSTAVDV